jgi:hypothetical protein
MVEVHDAQGLALSDDKQILAFPCVGGNIGWAQVEEDAAGLVDEQRSAHLLEGTGGSRLAECNGLGSDSHGWLLPDVGLGAFQSRDYVMRNFLNTCLVLLPERFRVIHPYVEFTVQRAANAQVLSTPSGYGGELEVTLGSFF